MTQKQLIEILSAFRKLDIENNQNLTRYEKELFKALIDKLKEYAK